MDLGLWTLDFLDTMLSIAPILLIGPSGMLGAAWRKLLEQRRVDCRYSDIPQFDFAKPDSIDQAVTDDLRTVINCGAYTDVDAAEEHEALAAMLNGSGVGDLARRCSCTDRRAQSGCRASRDTAD